MPSSLTIGINAVYLNPTRQGGAETYVRQLLNELLKMAPSELGPLRFVLFVARDSEFLEHTQLTNNSRFELVVNAVDARRKYRRIWWEQQRFPRLLRKYSLDLMHFPYGTMSKSYRGRSLVTVHDTLRFCVPEQMPFSQRFYRGWNERALRRNHVHVVSVSQADAALVHQHQQVPRERISVIYHGVLPDFFEVPRPAEFEPLNKPRLLWIGRPYPRKNVEVLIRAVHQLQAGFDIRPHLKLVGVEQIDLRRLQQVIRQTAASDLVELIPPVSHAELPRLLRDADFFVYPSLYESFGLPVLEALAAGVPTICADIPPFQELYREGVAFSPANSPNAWAKEIKTLCEEPERRRDLVEQGRKIAREFNWSRCAEEHVALYRRLTES